MSNLIDLPTNISFAKEEEKILQLWQRLDVFNNTLLQSQDLTHYSFYDGPPFATGLPHYGHILAGTIKDVITRYAHQNQQHVIRRFGWDCHGLPIEYEIDKKLNIRTPTQVLQFGMANYNQECKNIVMTYAKEWENIMTRLGRWVDFKNDYKTMDVKFMESVWWVFKTIFDKNMVYRGCKVMPYSTTCNTPLSNFEATSNYKEVHDPEFYVLFSLEEDKEINLIVWTTTPWTLTSNLALCVNADLEYVKVVVDNKFYILAATRLESIFKKFTIIDKFKGITLNNKKYIALFDYYVSSYNSAFRIVCDDYVKSDIGSGIVHLAATFGEDDYRICLANNIVSKEDVLPCPINENGYFITTEFEGLFLKDINELMKKLLKKQGRLLKCATIIHNYPFCWRSDTPLIYKAVPSWFIKVESIREKLIHNNKQTNWVPNNIKEGRFHNWLFNASDWAVSRNRYWGTPLPIWTNKDFSEIICIGSIAQLEKLSGVKITDLHREFIDNITISSSDGINVLRRVDEVFDCWFESGSMPYAQLHYPFENKDLFEATFPADFIAEGIDQTRGWFYTLLVISTILFDKAPFKNVIVNGLVLAEDGKKMSKKLRNYPDPLEIVNEFGSDALRLYLINSPATHACDLTFKKTGVKDMIRDILLPWYHSYKFLLLALNYPRNNSENNQQTIMDDWILAVINQLIKDITMDMQNYYLYNVVSRLIKFMDLLTNWYIRFNRKRLKSGNKCAIETLTSIEFTLLKIMAVFTPFLSETIYQHMRHIIHRKELSVHYLYFPKLDDSKLNVHIIKTFEVLKSIIDLGRIARDRRNISLKCPLKELTIIHDDQQILDDVKILQQYILDELNVKNLVFTTQQQSYIALKVKANRKILGKKLKKNATSVIAKLESLTQEEIYNFINEKIINILTFNITIEEVKIVKEFIGNTKLVEAVWDDNILVVLDLQVDKLLITEANNRKLINKIQQLRKQCSMVPSDNIIIYWYTDDTKLAKKIIKSYDFLHNALEKPFIFRIKDDVNNKEITQSYKIQENNITISILRL
jgi:isoleucyl-tRNA synthetase